MTLSDTPATPEGEGSDPTTSAEVTRAPGRVGRSKRTKGPSGPRGPRADQDIRNDPRYRTPWWRKPLKPWMFWTLAVVLVAIVVAAVIVCISLGIRLF